MNKITQQMVHENYLNNQQIKLKPVFKRSIIKNEIFYTRNLITKKTKDELNKI